jgi:Ca2+-binding RTX toxin-like protein
VADDPSTTDCDESLLLTRMPDGTIKYKQINTVDPSGINGQSVYNGTDSVDRVFGGNDNDTFWGQNGNDIIEGGFGDDFALGGNGNDIITDSGGADVLKGGPGNDALDGGAGDDIFMGGDGSDFINGGANDNEAFAGPGNDFMIAGQGADSVMGDGGDDWIQGGTGQDLLIGDHSAPFFDDPAELAPGNDVFVGQPGENDYDAEGGDDIMAQNAAVDRNAGAGGFDWAIHQYDTVGANDDMMINNNLAGVPIQVVINRDRWQETEADSGSAFDDVIKGTDGAVAVPSAIGGAGFTGCDVLDQAGVNRISGLAALLPPLTGDSATVSAISASGRCPLSGPFWGAGDIELGGAGNDSFTGRAGDDIIDGDRMLTVRISVRNDAGAEIGSADLMESQYLRTASGALTGPTLQQAVFAGTVDPGNLRIVREIVNNAGPTDVDTANYAGPRSQYTIVLNTNGSISVTDGAGREGTDTLWNIEQLQFTDVLVSGTAATAPAVTTTPAAATGLTFGNTNVGSTSASQVVTVQNTGNAPLAISGLAIAGTDFTITANTCLTAAIAANGTCTVNVAFVPTAAGARSATLQIADNASGSPQGVVLRGTGVQPAPTPATFVFGNQTTTSSVSDSNAAGVSEAFKVTSTQAGTVSQLRVFVDTGSVGPVIVGLYANSASNHPAALLRSGTVTTPVLGQFNTVVVPNLTVTTGTSYWIALLGPNGIVKFRDRHAAGNSETNRTNNANLPGSTGNPTAWATGGSFTDGALSAYAAGTVTSPPPPPPPPPGLNLLVGNGTTEAQADNDAAGRAEAFKTTASASGSVTQLRVFIDTGNTATNVQVGLYTDNAGHPGTLLTSGTLSAPTAGANNAVTVTGASVTAGQTYWIALLTPSGTGQVVRFRDRAQPAAALGQSEWSSSALLTALPATWASGTQFRDGFLSAIGLG